MPVPEARQAPGEMKVSLVAVLALGHCVAFADRNLPAVVAPLLKADLGLTDAQLGILMGPAFAVLYAVGMLATFPFAASHYRYRLLTGCIATWSLGMVAFALASSFEMLVAARALVGLGQSAYVPLALGLIVEGAPLQRRARSMAMFTAGSVIGRSVALLAGGLVLALLARWASGSELAHWRWIFLAMAVPNLVLIITLWRCRERPPLDAVPAAGFRQIVDWSRRRPALVGLYLCGAGGSVLVVQTIGAWAPSVLNREQGLTPAAASLVFGAALLVASPIGHMLAGTLVDRARRVTPLDIVAGGLLLIVPLIWALPLVNSAAAACGLLALASLVGGTAAVAALAGLPTMLPVQLRGAAVRLFLVFITVTGVGVGPYVTGLVSDGLGYGGQGLSTALSMVCMSAALFGLVAALLARPAWRRAAAELTA